MRYLEKVNRDSLIVYHRTKREDLLSILKEEGRVFTSSSSMYGPGLYTTFDIKSQMANHMQATYGDFIIEIEVPLRNLIIFNLKECKTVYGEVLTIGEQVKRITGFDYTKASSKNRDRDIMNVLPRGTDSLSFSSKLAKQFYEGFGDDFWYKKIGGLMYSGNHDGNCVVLYRVSKIVPLRVYKDSTRKVMSPDNWKAFRKKTVELYGKGFAEHYLDKDEDDSDRMKNFYLYSKEYMMYMYGVQNGLLPRVKNITTAVLDTVFMSFPDNETLWKFDDFLDTRQGQALRRKLDRDNTTYFNFRDILSGQTTSIGAKEINDIMGYKYAELVTTKGAWKDVDQEMVDYFSNKRVYTKRTR
jgi:hypothetical protein